MKHVDRTAKFDRVNSSIGVCAMIFDHFKDAWSFSSPRFRAWMLSAKLCDAESRSNFSDNSVRERQQIILA